MGVRTLHCTDTNSKAEEDEGSVREQDSHRREERRARAVGRWARGHVKVRCVTFFDQMIC
jgi:hypothetical protein